MTPNEYLQTNNIRTVINYEYITHMHENKRNIAYMTKVQIVL